MISLEENGLNELQRISTGRRVRKYLLNARQLSKQHQNWLIFITMPLCSPASKIILIRLNFFRIKVVELLLSELEGFDVVVTLNRERGNFNLPNIITKWIRIRKRIFVSKQRIIF